MQHLNNSGPQSGYNRVVSGLNTSTVGGESIRLRVQDLVLDTSGQAYSFVMDVNEGGGSQSRASLDRLIIWVDPSGTADTIPGTGTIMPNSLSSLQNALGVAPIYDMDAGGNNTVLIDGGIHAGSGLSDVSFFIPKSNFGNPAPSSYVYIWAEMGAYNADFAANSGNDSFVVPKSGTGLFLTPVVPIPEPGVTAFLFLVVPLALRRRRSLDRVNLEA
ncbi:hypothetical protein N9A94_02530 [Akkermansiaceae bacterium]|nr:hypothetical protein [Akkermansiaceae bacterium]MDB4537090.1 hypothetical protein [Akkermansiaceae bacterium]